MRTFFTEEPVLPDAKTAALSGEEHRHLSQVLRFAPDDELIIQDPEGRGYHCRIRNIDRHETSLEIIEPIEVQTENRIARTTLIQGMPKGSKGDLIVQKAVELGAVGYLPFYSHRSVVKPSKNDLKKQERLARIAREAAKQSGRVSVPEIAHAVSFDEMKNRLQDFDLILLAYENEDNTRLKEILREVTPEGPVSIGLIIGPEGGFEDWEVKELCDAGARVFTFGERILRTETAGLCALSQINYEFDEA